MNQSLINSLSFCDAPIRKMEVDLQKKQIKFFMEYAYIKDKSDQLFKNRDDWYLGEGVLVIEEWQSLNVLLYDQQGKNPEILDFSQLEPLQDIQVFQQTGPILKIAGFSVNIGRWMEPVFDGGILSGEFQEFDSEI